MALVGNNLLASGAYIKARMGLAAERRGDRRRAARRGRRASRATRCRVVPGSTELLAACKEAGVPTAW